jgi:site-specific DNA-methyltransferase (adenine-specific)
MKKPPYQRKEVIGIANCYQGDCMDFMKTVPDKFYELAIVDPPYGIDWMQQIKNPNTKKNWKRYESKEWDKEPPHPEYFKELFRVSKNQIIWGGNYFNLPPTPCIIIWDKMQEFSGAVFEVAWSSFESPAKAFRMSRVEAYPGDNKIHPTQKPVALYKWILSRYAKPGDHILDTHGGSGSSAVACINLGFSIDWIELDEDYYEAAIKRIASANLEPWKYNKSKLNLFEGFK